MSDAAQGFYGKLPTRGDFVRAGLPRSFVDPWDAWLQTGLAAARARLGAAWEPAWMEAPVWRFRLPAGACGPDAVAGVFMPSVDRAGRLFPLTFANMAPQRLEPDWLDRAAAAGIAALEHDLEPQALANRLELALPPEAARLQPPADPRPGACLWWTEGAPRVPAGHFASPGLPDCATFTRMIDTLDPS
jgi:type VI secretion system protein ImpM